MEPTLYLTVFPRPLEGREAEAHGLWAQRREVLQRWDEPAGGLGAWLGGTARRQRHNERLLEAIDTALEGACQPVSASLQGARVGLDPEADSWFEKNVFCDPSHAAELRRMLATEDGPPVGPLSLADCRQAFIGAPVAALEVRRAFASLLYALPYPSMEFRLTAAWCRTEFPRQRWSALQWPQERWPDGDALPDWVPERQWGVTAPLLPQVGEQFATRFEAELMRALAPLPGLKGIPSRRVRTTALHVWRYAGDPPGETQDPDADPGSEPLPPLPAETRRKLSFAADLLDQITWIRRWSGLAHPLGLELA